MSKYQRIADDLRVKITAGTYKPGEQLPPEAQLAELYSCALTTLTRALADLATEGLIDKRHGSGNFVRVPRPRLTRTPERYQFEKDQALLGEPERRATGATEADTGLPSDQLRFHAEYATETATRELAKELGVRAGAKLLRRTYRTSTLTGDPLALSVSWMPYAQAAKNPDLLDATNEPWPGGTMHQLSTLGIEVARVVDTITARPPSAAMAEALDLPRGVAVLMLHKVLHDRAGRPVEVCDVALPGDSTELRYSTDLKPWES